jgi:small subunit ribosomal protein S17
VRVGKKTRVGVVVESNTSKTVQVRVYRAKKERIIGKNISVYSNYAVHDQNEEAKISDLIEIEECRPVSKTKKWKVKRIITKSVGESIELKDELEALKPAQKLEEKKEKGV